MRLRSLWRPAPNSDTAIDPVEPELETHDPPVDSAYESDEHSSEADKADALKSENEIEDEVEVKTEDEVEAEVEVNDEVEGGSPSFSLDETLDGTGEGDTPADEPAQAEPSNEPSEVPENQTSHVRRRVITIVAAGIVALVATSGIAWQLDATRRSDTVARNTTMLGTKIGGLSRAQLRETVVVLERQFSDSSITLYTERSKRVLGVSESGLAINIDATVEHALTVDRKRSPLMRYVRFLRSAVQSHEVQPSLYFTNNALDNLARSLDEPQRKAPQEPSLKWQENTYVIEPGKRGIGYTGDALRDALVTQATSLPISVRVKQTALPPSVSPHDAQAFLASVIDATASPVTAQTDFARQTLQPNQYRPVLRSRVINNKMQLTYDPASLSALLTETFRSSGTQPTEANFTVQNEAPVPQDGKPGYICCDASANDTVFAAIRATDPSAKTTPKLALHVVPPKSYAKDLDPLKITEVVGEFTTRHAPNQPRVHNIHRISDMVRGTVIKPGETFSLNRAVGPRTPEKGFVVDHVIIDGKFADSVGGGISQFATTTFNAAFFAGLDFGEYQSHSIYIDRYPYGREATISYPHPDLQIKNNTPYGILLWPSYSATSITVKLYSTRYATGEQVGQSKSQVRNCTRVETLRKRTYTDGRVVNDKVFALYQPSEGEKCK